MDLLKDLISSRLNKKNLEGFITTQILVDIFWCVVLTTQTHSNEIYIFVYSKQTNRSAAIVIFKTRYAIFHTYNLSDDEFRDPSVILSG